MTRKQCLMGLLFFAMAVPGRADVPLPEGAVLSVERGSHRSQITISRVVTEEEYSVYYLIDEAGPVCGMQDGQDVGAIPISGSWGPDMSWSPEGVTMACINGPIGKCVTWGYLPWDAALRDYHQACVRMVRADYCGTGHGTTRDGTPIDVWDSKGINERSDDDTMLHEADWDASGATAIFRTRFKAGLDYVRENCPERLAGSTGNVEARSGLLSNGSRPDR